MLHGNSQLLVRTLEDLTLLDGRFSGLKLMNMSGGEKRGHFSLVFRAYDELEERFVALKFIDLDPAKQDRYRLMCFEREHQILELLKGAPRCLQVFSTYSTYELCISIAGQTEPITIPAKYFATDWIEGDIDEYFSRQDTESPIEKLKIFNEVVLAVESLHTRHVFHRDLKVDNFRCRESRDAREIVAIDLGAAARYDSEPMLPAYGCPVGFLMYSAPEAFCGMAGIRSIAPLTDIFALGCMLFELFHPDDYPSAYRAINTDFDLRFSALKARIDCESDEKSKVAAWDLQAPKMLQGLSPVSLSDNGSSAPAAICDLLSELIAEMTAPDFRSRIRSFAKARQRCWSAIRVLENEAFDRRRTLQVATRRAMRAAKATARAERAKSATRLVLPNGTCNG